MKKISVKLKTVPINITEPSLKIAVAQIYGPQPDGKHISFVMGKDTFAWKSQKDIDFRLAKAETLIKSVKEHHPGVKIIIFPEYSLPVNLKRKFFQDLADNFDMIIIAGSDNFQQVRGGKILNTCPVFIPKCSKPYLTHKRCLSTWETEYMDYPSNQTILPVFTWESKGRKYWFAVYICLDIMYALDDKLADFESSGIYFVPMFSPEIGILHTYSNTFIRNEYGRVCVFCNAVGDNTVGESRVITATPTGRKDLNSLCLNSFQQLAVFDLNFNEQTREGTNKVKNICSITDHKIYNINEDGQNFQITPCEEEINESPLRAVINPEIYAVHGVQLRIAFLKVNNFYEAMSRGRNQNSEILAVLGHSDLMISHLGSNDEEMFYDIDNIILPQNAQVISTEINGDATHQQRHDHEYFVINKYYKVLGRTICDTSKNLLGHASIAHPSKAELEQVTELGVNYNSLNISDKEREDLLAKRFILGTTTKSPGDISSVISFTIINQENRIKNDLLAQFEFHIIPKLLEQKSVTSLFRGIGHNIDIDFIARIDAEISNLYDTIEAIHKACSDARMLVRTTTFVVVKKISNLNLNSLNSIAHLPGEDSAYRNRQIFPWLTVNGIDKFRKFSAEKQREIIHNCRDFEAVLDRISVIDSLKSKQPHIKMSFIQSFIEGDNQLLQDPFNLVQAAIESFLFKIIKIFYRNNLEEDVTRAKNITKHSVSTLSFGDKVNVVMYLGENRQIPISDLNVIKNLNNTVAVRNNFAHVRYHQISISDYIKTFEIFSEFISEWDQIDGALSKKDPYFYKKISENDSSE